MTVLALLGLPSAAVAAPASVPVPFPGLDGAVYAVLVDGDTAYLGGHFSEVGRSSGPLVTLSAADGAVQRTHADIAGRAFPYTVEDVNVAPRARHRRLIAEIA